MEWLGLQDCLFPEGLAKGVSNPRFFAWVLCWVCVIWMSVMNTDYPAQNKAGCLFINTNRTPQQQSAI